MILGSSCILISTTTGWGVLLIYRVYSGLTCRSESGFRLRSREIVTGARLEGLGSNVSG